MADGVIEGLQTVIGNSADTVNAFLTGTPPMVADVVPGASAELQQVDVTAVVATLSQLEGAQVIDAVHDLGHPATQDELDDLVQRAQEAEAHRGEAEALQHEQAKAAEQGDYARAHDLEHDAAYSLQAAADAGGHVGTAVIDALKEGVALDNADWQQQIAHAAAHDAVASADAGDAYHASAAAHVADDHAATAADYGHAGDHGGAMAVHDATTDASATTDA